MIEILYSSPLKPNEISSGASSLGGYVSSSKFQNDDPFLFSWVMEDKKHKDSYKALFIKNLSGSPLNLSLWTEDPVGFNFSLSLVQPATHPSCNCPWIESIHSENSPPLISQFTQHTELSPLTVQLNGNSVLGLWVRRVDSRVFQSLDSTGILDDGVWDGVQQMVGERENLVNLSLIIEY